MKIWLENQFPDMRYSAIRIIFPPLVGWNQSAAYFSDNGFTEAQAHVSSRGFVRFKEFNQKLLRLYKSRNPDQTVTDLYTATLSGFQIKRLVAKDCIKTGL